MRELGATTPPLLQTQQPPPYPLGGALNTIYTLYTNNRNNHNTYLNIIHRRPLMQPYWLHERYWHLAHAYCVRGCQPLTNNTGYKRGRTLRYTPLTQQHSDGPNTALTERSCIGHYVARSISSVRHNVCKHTLFLLWGAVTPVQPLMRHTGGVRQERARTRARPHLSWAATPQRLRR